MEEVPSNENVNERPKPTDRMAAARAALSRKRAEAKLLTLKKEAEKINEKIKDADEYSKTHPPIPVEQPMEVEIPKETPILQEEKEITIEKQFVQEKPPEEAPAIQEAVPMSSSEDIVITPIEKENRIEAAKSKPSKNKTEKKKKTHERGKRKRDKSSSSSQEEEYEKEPSPRPPPQKRQKLDPIPPEPVPKNPILSGATNAANQVVDRIRSINVPSHVTNFARDTATNCGWACVIFAGVILQRYAVKVSTNYLFPNGFYPGHERYPARPGQPLPPPAPSPTQQPFHPPAKQGGPLEKYGRPFQPPPHPSLQSHHPSHANPHSQYARESGGIGVGRYDPLSR